MQAYVVGEHTKRTLFTKFLPYITKDVYILLILLVYCLLVPGPIYVLCFILKLVLQRVWGLGGAYSFLLLFPALEPINYLQAL